MSRLQAIRHSRGKKQQEVCKHLKAKGFPLDSSLFSKMENDVCLPVPKCAEEICHYYCCAIGDIYEPDEVTFPGVVPQPESKKTSPDLLKIAALQKTGSDERKVQFKLTEWACKSLQIDVLKACGYRTKTEWFYECLRELSLKYQSYQNGELSVSNLVGVLDSEVDIERLAERLATEMKSNSRSAVSGL
jgi:hypothetical protein